MSAARRIAPRKAAVFLWFDGQAEAAAAFYAATFPESRLERIVRAPEGLPNVAAGAVQLVEMTLCGLPYALPNGGPQAELNDAYSLQVYAEDQAETDRLWGAILGTGGGAIMCGWCTDRWGYRWQITPRVPMDALADPDRAAAARAMAATMEMDKIDIAAIDAARSSVTSEPPSADARGRWAWSGPKPGVNADVRPPGTT